MKTVSKEKMWKIRPMESDVVVAECTHQDEERGKASELGNLVTLEIFPRLLSSGGVETKFANQEVKSGKLGKVSARNEHDS